MENNFFSKFAIKGLFGYKNIEIVFNNPVLIVIGENGFGKTTILNAINFVLQKQYRRLAQIKFGSISVTCADGELEFSHVELEKYLDYLQRKEAESDNLMDYIVHRLSSNDYEELRSYIMEGRKKEFHNFANNNEVLKEIPENMIFETLYTQFHKEKVYDVFSKLEKIVESFNCEVLYYPTYRRIEVDMENLGLDIHNHRRLRFEEEERIYAASLRNIRFGMADVTNRIQEVTKTISQSFIAGFAEASGEMIRQLLHNPVDINHSLEYTERELRIVLARIGTGLSEEEKEAIMTMKQNGDAALSQNTYLNYFLDRLITLYRKQEKYDTAIKQFCKVCNNYFRDKRFVYDESNVRLNIYRLLFPSQDDSKIGEEVLLDQLSSGEKQIVSIFSQVYLDIDKKYILLLDEPELSLSIFWQKNLLPDIIKSERCQFLLAVTHSPFIFGEELKQYTIGINEFLVKEE